MTLTVVQGSNRTQALLQRIKLVAPSFGWWHGSYQLKGAEVTLAGNKLEAGKTTRPQLKIMEQTPALVEYKKKFQKLNSEMAAIRDFYGEDFPAVNGVRQVPITAVGPMLHEIVGKVDAMGKPVFDADRYVPRTGKQDQSLAYRLGLLADEFAAAWPELREEMIATLATDVWENVQRRVPSASRMREKFYIEVAMVELASGSDGDEAVAEFNSTGAAVDDATRYVQASMQRQVDTAIEQLVSGPRLALAEALKQLNELISRDGNVTDRSFNAVRAAIAKLRMFDFAADHTMMDSVRQLEHRIAQTAANSLNSNSNAFLELTNTVIASVEDAVKIDEDIARFGRARRAVAL